MDYKFKKENYEFWVERLKHNETTQVCTNDVGLDKLESKQILSKVSNHTKILEIGCGNGLLYQELRKNFNLERYIGTDFVSELIKECEEKIIDSRDEFKQLDMTEVSADTFDSKFDFIISKRAIQNVIDHNIQMQTIDKFGSFLKDDGLMILVESSKQAQSNINFERRKYNLTEIKPPFHNLFFDDQLLESYKFKNIELIDVNPFASDFYFITRIVYARLANEYLFEKTNYDHPLEKIALSMEESQCTTGFSQIKCYTFKKN